MLAGLEVAGTGIVGGTVVRQHLMVSLASASTDTDPSWLWGTVMWPKTRVAANVPDVISDFYIDWTMIREVTPGTAPQSFQNSGFTEFLYGGEYDIKAKRRITQMDESLFFCLYNGGTASGTYTIFSRTLIALP
jgi:hypothetical protein